MAENNKDGQQSLDGDSGKERIAAPSPPRELVHFAGREILDYDDRQYETVEVPEWNQDGATVFVRLRGLTGSERDAWEASLLKDEGGRRPKMDYTNLRAKLIVHSWVDGDGRRVFNDRDAPALGRMSASALQRLFEVCQKLSRLTDEDVEELTKNSNAAENGATGSDSPTTSVSP